MHWLAKDACPNDSLFFQYSGFFSSALQHQSLLTPAGHGGQPRDPDGDEVVDCCQVSQIGGYDTVIYPKDFRQVGLINRDEMHRIMSVRLYTIFDSRERLHSQF